MSFNDSFVRFVGDIILIDS